MNAYKVDAVVIANGLTIFNGLPLLIGAAVEVIILDNRVDGQIVADVSDKKSTDSSSLD